MQVWARKVAQALRIRAESIAWESNRESLVQAASGPSSTAAVQVRTRSAGRLGVRHSASVGRCANGGQLAHLDAGASATDRAAALGRAHRTGCRRRIGAFDGSRRWAVAGSDIERRADQPAGYWPGPIQRGPGLHDDALNRHRAAVHAREQASGTRSRLRARGTGRRGLSGTRAGELAARHGARLARPLLR